MLKTLNWEERDGRKEKINVFILGADLISDLVQKYLTRKNKLSTI